MEHGKQQACRKVVGIGGAGGNIAAQLMTMGCDAEFVVMNTDRQALNYHPCKTKVYLDLGGRSEGQPQLDRQAALQSRAKIEAVLTGAELVVLLAGLGGRCGTASTPIVAQFAGAMGARVVSVVTMPFPFEGQKRAAKAEEGLRTLQKATGRVLVFQNSELLKSLSPALPMQDVFQQSDKAVCRGVLSMLFAQPSGCLKTPCDAGFAHFTLAKNDEAAGDDKP